MSLSFLVKHTQILGLKPVGASQVTGADFAWLLREGCSVFTSCHCTDMQHHKAEGPAGLTLPEQS